MDHQKKIFGVAPGPFEVKKALKLLEGQKGRILDLGCGLGKLTKAIKKNRPDLEIYGCDISREAIKKAKKDSQKVHFRVGSSDCLPYKENFFDAVFARHVLEHLEEIDLMMSEVKRVLKKKGNFYSITPLEGSPFTFEYWARKIELIKQARDKYSGHLHFFSFKDLRGVIEKSNFRVENYFFEGFFLYQLIDCFYFPFLVVLKRDFSFSFRDAFTVRRKPGLWRKLAIITKMTLEIIFEAENIFWQKIKTPGFIIYFKATRV